MSIHHRIVIIGGGDAGISVAARLRNAGQEDVAIIEPKDTHYYQPLWTMVGGGQAKAEESARSEASVMPQGVAWIKDAATSINPEENTVELATGTKVTYDYLVVAPGLQLDWDYTPGLQAAMETPYVSSNYGYDLAPKTWEMIQKMKSGTAIFTMPIDPIKCGGAPQKIAYLAADYWRQQGVLDNIKMILIIGTPTLFSAQPFSDELEKIAADYGIEVRLNTHMTDIDGEAKKLTVKHNESGETETLDYDFVHAVPHQSAPDWLKGSPLADTANDLGYVAVDKHTMQHVKYPNIFSLGDAANLPTSKTGAAIRKQAPVMVKNLIAVMNGDKPILEYNGYSSCPLVTSRSTVLLAEFDYDKKPTPSFPVDTTKPRKDMWVLKRYGLPFMYWNFILKGRM